MVEATQAPKSLKAQITRTSLVLSAAALLREEGPKAVTYRRVAKGAGAASSSVGYYFESVSQLLSEAAKHNIRLWCDRAEGVAQMAVAVSCEECRRNLAEYLVRACLPDDTVALSAHYSQLVAASDASEVTEAYREGRGSINGAVAVILRHAGVDVPSSYIPLIVDGAALEALSEGRDVRDFVLDVMAETISDFA